MHQLLPPVLTTLTNPDGSKRRKKFTVADSQESFALIGKTCEELDAKLNLLKIQNSHINPILLVEGEIVAVKSISIYFEGIKYPIIKPVTAVDILFKIMLVFDLEFPKQAETFYMFLQTFFYNIPTFKNNLKVAAIEKQLLE